MPLKRLISHIHLAYHVNDDGSFVNLLLYYLETFNDIVEFNKSSSYVCVQ